MPWLSGRVLDLRPRGCGFEPHWGHCLVSLSKNINPSLVLVQPRKTRPFKTERLLMGRKETNQTSKQKKAFSICDKYQNLIFKLLFVFIFQENIYQTIISVVVAYSRATRESSDKLAFHAVQSPLLLAHIKNGCRWRLRQNHRQWAPLDSRIYIPSVTQTCYTAFIMAWPIPLHCSHLAWPIPLHCIHLGVTNSITLHSSWRNPFRYTAFILADPFCYTAFTMA